jgi:hypothetical protein
VFAIPDEERGDEGCGAATVALLLIVGEEGGIRGSADGGGSWSAEGWHGHTGSLGLLHLGGTEGYHVNVDQARVGLTLDARLEIARLLDGVDEFMGEERLALRSLRSEAAGAEHDVVAKGVGESSLRTGRNGGCRIVVDAHVSKIGAEAIRHGCLKGGVERTTGTEGGFESRERGRERGLGSDGRRGLSARLGCGPGDVAGFGFFVRR